MTSGDDCEKQVLVSKCGSLPAETETLWAIKNFIKAHKGSFIGFVELWSGFSFQYLSSDCSLKELQACKVAGGI